MKKTQRSHKVKGPTLKVIKGWFAAMEDVHAAEMRWESKRTADRLEVWRRELHHASDHVDASWPWYQRIMTARARITALAWPTVLSPATPAQLRDALRMTEEALACHPWLIFGQLLRADLHWRLGDRDAAFATLA